MSEMVTQEGVSAADRLLVEASRMFREKGYAATTTRELASSLGLQNASLYHHIRSKEDLLFKICVAALTDVTATFEAALTIEDPLESLRKLFRDYIELVLSDRDRHAAMLVEIRSLTAGHREEIVTLRDKNVRLVRERIELAQSKGELRGDVSPAYLSLAFFNLANWSLFWFTESGELSASELAAVFEDLYLAGATPR